MSAFDRNKLRKQLERHEGVKLDPYLDTLGNLTGGIGHLMRKRLSMQAVEQLYIDDVHEVEDALDANLSWWRSLSDVRQRVLVDMCFNLGIAGLKGFKTFLRELEAGNYGRAADAMLLSKWATQVKTRAVRLAQMMRLDADPVS